MTAVIAIDNTEQLVGSGPQAPFEDSVVITPSDTNELAEVTRAIRCNTAGALTVVMRDESSAVLYFAAGETRFVSVRKIMATGTTVSGAIEALN